MGVMVLDEVVSRCFDPCRYIGRPVKMTTPGGIGKNDRPGYTGVGVGLV